MSEREKILARVREALQVKAAIPAATQRDATSAVSSGAREWLPNVGASFHDQMDLFARNAAALKADFQLFNSADELSLGLAGLGVKAGWKKVAGHSGELNDAIRPALNLPWLSTDEEYRVDELEACDAGISECDALIAQAGTVLVTNRSAGGRALSVLPPHHVVLARREQLVPDLPAAFELLKQKYAGGYPSMISFITGPSRTGDIERILVLGAHGPKQLTILCF